MSRTRCTPHATAAPSRRRAGFGYHGCVLTKGGQPGDQSDLAGATQRIAGGADRARAPRPEPNVGQRGSGPSIAVIPLHGQVGGEVGGRLAGTFDAAIFASCLERAERDSAEVNRSRSEAERAARVIERVGRTDLGRRIAIGDRVIERLREDRKLIRVIPALLRAETWESLEAAIERFNELVTEWQELLASQG